MIRRHETHPSRAPRVALLLLFCPVVALAAVPQGRVRIGQVEFDAAATVGGRELPMRGGTLCRHRTFKVYTAAFYTAPEAKSAADILSGRFPMRLVLHYHREIEGGDITKAAERTLEGNPRLNLIPLRSRLNQVNAIYKDVKEGDRYWMDYVPGAGCELFFNGQSQVKIEGADFASAYFGIWLSEHSISNKYRDRLLGK